MAKTRKRRVHRLTERSFSPLHGRRLVKSRRTGKMIGWMKAEMGRCTRCGRTIFGGPKGMRTHLSKKHRRR